MTQTNAESVADVIRHTAITASAETLAAAIVSRLTEAGRLSEGWREISEDVIPKGDMFDVMWPDGRRAIDCHWDAAHKRVVLRHGYPTVLTIFRPQPKWFMSCPVSPDSLPVPPQDVKP